MKIAEYIQIGTEIEEMPVQVEDDEVSGHYEIVQKETPVYGIVYRDATEEELKEQQDTLDQYAKDRFYEEMNTPLTPERKMQLFIESVNVEEKPANRPGYFWIPLYNKDQVSFGWEEVKDPYYVPVADGSYINPFTFEKGMTVQSGMWYTNGDDIWECIKDGVCESFADLEYFDVIF